MTYPSDISREDFEKIRPILEQARKKTNPRQHDLYDLFNAVLYLQATGCQWRALPKDFPKWNAVYRHFQTWSEVRENGESLLETCLKKLSTL